MPAIVLAPRGLGRAVALSPGLRFVLVGSAGFAVDLCTCKALMIAGLPPLLARVPSMLVGLAVTFLLHRATAMPSSRPLAEQLIRYGQANAAVAAMNYTVFAVALLATHALLPLAALLVGSGAGFAVSMLDLKDHPGRRAANDDARRAVRFPRR